MIAQRFEGWITARVVRVLDYIKIHNPELVEGERGKTYDWSGCSNIEQVPGKCSGAPILVGARVFAEQLPGCAASGMTAQEIADAYELNVEQVRRVLAYTSIRVAKPQ